MPEALLVTAVPFVATHQLIIFRIGRIFGVELCLERLVAQQPEFRRLDEFVPCPADEFRCDDTIALSDGIDRARHAAALVERA